MPGLGSSGGGQGGIPGGPLGPILAALAALGAAGLITWTIVNGGGGGGDKTPTADATQLPPTVSEPSAVAPTQPPSSSRPHAPAGVNKEELKEGFDDAAVLVITAYGMPARVSAAADNPDEELSGAFVKQCIPDDIFPEPCVSYLVVKRGASVTVQAGDSKAGYWPVLDSVSGACNLTGNGQDQTCTFTLYQDSDIVAVYSGGESPGLSHYQYPTCPTQRGNASAPWTSRCP